MNYTKAQLDAMPDLEGSTTSSKLKIVEPEKRVWLLREKRAFGEHYSVLIETKQGMYWIAAKRYPA